MKKLHYKFHILSSNIVLGCFKSYSKTSNLINLLLTMPKEKPHTAVLKSQRLLGKKKNQKYVPGNVSIQVLGSGARGAPRSLYIFTDHSRYLFNCGEGTQRLAHEHKMKLSKLEHIFVTHLSWDNVGGLPGVALTIQDVGVPEITLHGPDGVDEIFNATRRFVILKNMSVKTVDCLKGRFYEDNILTVKYVPLVSSEKKIFQRLRLMDRYQNNDEKEASEDDTDYYAHERTGQRVLTKRKRSPTSVFKRAMAAARETDVAMGYIVKLADRPGSLCLERCVEAGVPPGPLLGRLKAGENVTLENGNVVKSVDVTLPDEAGTVFIVVEVPSEDFLPALDGEIEFSKHYDSCNSPDNYPFIVVHFTPLKIMQHPIYQNFMGKFPISTHHLLMNDSADCMGSIAVHRIQQKLNMLDSGLFPLLADRSIPLISDLNKSEDDMPIGSSMVSPDDERFDAISNLKKKFSIVRASTLWRSQLRPAIKLDSNVLGCLTLNPEEYIEEVNNVEGFEELLNKLKLSLSRLPPATWDGEYPNIVFFGTGSCIPNKTRNTSAILLNISKDLCMLLDCGEGTWGQMVRFYGWNEAYRLLSNMKAIYLSHLHADHHIGLLGILSTRKLISGSGAEQDPLYLLAPAQISSWLDMYHNNVEPLLKDVILIPNQELMHNKENGTINEVKLVLDQLNLLNISTCRVVHCPNSFGVSLKHKSGFKLTYSGDTMPCSALVTIGQDSDLLIHEATMEDELADEAKEKLHSTVSEAISAGRSMNAKFTLLTHFSQRYAKLPRLDHDAFTMTSDVCSRVGIAFDNMKVKFSDLDKLPLMYSALKAMFQEDYEELEIKSMKRQLKLERSQKSNTITAEEIQASSTAVP